jgi:hypothetical protein
VREPPSVGPNAAEIVRAALAGSGVEAVACSTIEAYDARAPEDFRSAALFPGARGVVVAASAGPALWRLFLERTRARPSAWDDPHPYDAFVAELLDRADVALAAAGVRYLRFEAAFDAPVRVDFVALAELAGMGRRGPFGLLVHPAYGPWWALRGAWLVDAEVVPAPRALPACEGCDAPCVGGWEHARSGVTAATPEVRARCVVGQDWRYDEDQIAYHYARAEAVKRLRVPAGRGR